MKKAFRKAKNSVKKAAKVTKDVTRVASKTAHQLAPIAQALAPEYADQIDQGLQYSDQAADYARRGNKIAQQYELEQTFGWDDFKKGLKKATKIGKDVINKGMEIAEAAKPLAE